MSDPLIFSQLPTATSIDAGDGLLVVKNGQPRQISQQAAISDQIAEVAWVIEGATNQGIGTANAWATIPYNQVIAPAPWLTLGADGAMNLAPGIYLVDSWVNLNFVNYIRIRLEGAITHFYGETYNGASTNLYPTLINPRRKITLTQTTAIRFQVNVSSARADCFYSAGGNLAGFSPTIAQAFIWRLG
jgi:hypothetical protein